MSKKPIYLFLALVLPGLIFVFLKFFGHNEFDVQTYYQTEITPPAGCNGPYTLPYQLPDSILSHLSHDPSVPLALLWRDGSRSLAEMNRLEQLKGVELDILGAGRDTTVVVGRRIAIDKNIFECSLLLHEPYNAVLVDSARRIRGYYELSRRDEVDRLMLEVDILLKKY